MTRFRRKPFAAVIAALAVFALAVAATFAVRAGETPPQGSSAPPPHRRWSAEAVEIVAQIPVQDGGRVKPLSTYAKFAMLALNGRDWCPTPSGDIHSTEWFLDCVFFPEEAVHYPCFVIDDSTSVLDAVGLPHEGKSVRDRYSYADFEPALQKINEVAGQYSLIEEKDRDAVQGQLINLAHNLTQFETIAYLAGPAVHGASAAESPALVKVFGKDAQPTFADLLDHAAELKPYIAGGDDPHSSMAGDAVAAGADPALRGWVAEVVQFSRGIAIFPPQGSTADHAEWMSPSDVAAQVLLHGETLKPQVAAMRELEAMAAARDDDYAFRGHAEALRSKVVGLAEARGEYGKIPLEVTFYRADLFFWAQLAFVLAFVCVALSWMKSAKVFTWGATGALVGATALLVAGITMRCIIRGRPPVSTLYETILFITAIASIASMITEYVNRRGIALALATVLGSGGMFLANRYELQEHIDTMPSLVAVLDTNFWLASHVTCVTIGYAAGLLAGAVGHVYVLGKVFGLKKNDSAFYKSLSTMTYGTLCFGLLFSVVGTVLGGIWANDSWGRFWGWDPKENGALTIVLWEIIILHARMGGFLRDFGVAMAAVFGTAVVASSWWGVNLLGVGLHSYGFTSGILVALLVFYAVEAVVLSAGGVHLLMKPASVPTYAPGAPPPLPPA